jgi:hypothetical protein
MTFETAKCLLDILVSKPRLKVEAILKSNELFICGDVHHVPLKYAKNRHTVNSIIYKFFILVLTPWSRGLLEKLTVSQLVKNLPAFYGTRRFITTFTRAPHLSLS